MSLPSQGSTAPAITSPLLAWPSLPTTRSPLSTPPTSASLYDTSISCIYSRQPLPASRSLASSLTRADTWNTFAGDKKGKGKAIEPIEARPERHYAPPKQPLTPHQLSRIAQSFGIIVPSLPPPSPSSPAAGPSRLRLDAPSRPSPYLLTVIPPLSLLSLKSLSPEEADKRTRRWRRGRLIALQPSLAGMLVAIAREFGLPNTTGLQVYMGTSASSASSAASFSSDDPGPQISASSWTALFGPHLHGSVSSRSTTPTDTPTKPSGSLGRDIPFPLSPLSLVEKKLEHERLNRTHHRLKSFSSAAPLTAPSVRSLGSDFPTPPSTAGANPIIGTIEFDVDPDLASWYPEYRRSGRYRKSSTSSESGIRPLRLPQHLSAASPSFRPRRSQSRTQALRNSDEYASGDTTLNDHEEYRLNRQERGKDFPAIQSRAPEGRRLSVQRNGGVLSTAGSFGEMTDPNVSFGSSSGRSGDQTRMDVPEIMLHSRETSGGETYRMEAEEDLLASPIMLDGLLTPVGKVRERDGDVKRGSAVVMSEQLDDLERIMRQLSPRDIRLTSPRMLTPRMAAKVATSKLQFPVEPPARAPSTLSRNPINSDYPSALHSSSAAASSLTVNTIATQSSVPSFDATTLSRPPLEAEYSDAGLPLPAWPAVPFAKLSESPGSPGSIHDYFRAQTVAPSSPISPETLTRMRVPSPPDFPGRAPRRPNRPPSPDLTDSSIPHHSLPAEYVEQLHAARSPGGTVAGTPASPGPTRLKSRSGSISLKGLKMGSRNFGWKRSEHEKPPPPALPLGTRRDGEGEGEAVGLFGTGDKLSPTDSTFPSVGRSATPAASGSTTEFGQLPPAEVAQPSTASSKGSGKDSSFSRWMNPFGSRRSNNGPPPPDSPKSTSASKRESSKDRSSRDRGSKSSRRHPSVDQRTIGSPVSGSLKRHPQPALPSASISASGSASLGHKQSPSTSSVHTIHRPGLPGLSSSATTYTVGSEPIEEGGHGAGPTSPRSIGQGQLSPRSVKRKPVPPPLGEMPVRQSEDGASSGMKASMSMGSVASYTGEERRGNVGLGMGVRAG